jgi:[protein-PII] uridylyltransferase
MSETASSKAASSKAAILRAAIAAAQHPSALAEILLAERARLKEANSKQPQGVRACRALTEATDAVIQRMLLLSLPEGPQRDATRPKICVAATGGYGRRELCPHSDIDVTFIVAGEEDAALDATVRQMFLLLMEIFSQRVGLKVGYAYRNLYDVTQLDHQTQTALLDTRVIAGSHGLADQFLLKVFRHIWPAAFVRQKVAERRLLWEKHGGSLHRIEPEIREGPGGLRDLHLAEWLAAVSFPQTRGDVWRQLQRLGAVSRRDEQEVTAARNFVLTVRTWMHWETGRPADLLIRERQEGLAEALDYQDDDRASRVERFMEKVYEHAENISRVTTSVVDRCLSERLSLTDELVASGGELQPGYPWIQVSSPQFLVELGQHFQEHGLVPGYDLRRMISQHIDTCPDLSVDGEAAANFIGLLQASEPVIPPNAPHLWATRGPGGTPGVYNTLKLLADLGILQRLLPEIGEAFRRVPFDQIHRHTIGFHSLEGVRCLEQLRFTEDEKIQDFRRIWAEVQAPELLYLATLLHDIGKLAAPSTVGAPGHTTAGAEIASDICHRLRLDAPSMARVEKLVRCHLIMSETAQLRDLTLDKTIEDFTQEIDSVDLLNMLVLLTYADMEATGVLSPVKIRFLEDLYYRAEPRLTGGQPDPAQADDRARRFRSRLSRRLSGANLTPEQIREHTEGMPVSYLLNTRPEQVALHIRMVDTLLQNGPVVEFDDEMGVEITTVHVCTLERPEPGLLSQIAGVLYAHEVAVHGAQVFTRASEPPVALDTLWADYHGRGVPPLKRLELEQDLVSVLKDGDVEGVIARYRKQLPPPIPPRRVRIDNGLAESHSVLEIEVENQPGLLYRITRAFAALRWNIHSARISTSGDSARDAFYVTNAGDGKLLEDEGQLVDAFLAEFGK